MIIDQIFHQTSILLSTFLCARVLQLALNERIRTIQIRLARRFEFVAELYQFIEQIIHFLVCFSHHCDDHQSVKRNNPVVNTFVNVCLFNRFLHYTLNRIPADNSSFNLNLILPIRRGLLTIATSVECVGGGCR